MTSDDTKLSDVKYFDNFPVIIGEGSSSELRNLPEFAEHPSPFSHDTVTALLSRCLPAGVTPGPHSRSENEQPQELLLPLSGPFQTRGYPSFESPLNTEDT